MRHLATGKFWDHFALLPAHVQELARKNFEVLKENPRHPSLHFKHIGEYRSVRIGLHHRALGLPVDEGILWFWIGSHADYDQLLSDG